MRTRPSLLFPACLGLGVVSAACAEVTGILRDNLGHGLSNLTVKASYFDSVTGSTQAVATTDAAGHFDLSGEAGYWTLEVPASELNALGYLSVFSQFYPSDNTFLRLATRKLDFTHRVAGKLVDETGQPLAGYSLRARITENNALFETNLVTAADGSLMLAATPAVWTFFGLAPPVGGSTARVLGEQPVEVEVTNLEKQVTLTAPAATSTILLTTTNLGGWDIVIETEAFGRSYRLVKPVPLEEDATLSIEVFSGAWRLFVTNSDPRRFFPPVTLPAPLLIAVTNQGVSVTLAGIPIPRPAEYVLPIRMVTASGIAVTNCSISAQSGRSFRVPPIPLPANSPGSIGLSLPEGRWSIIGSTRVYPIRSGWDVSRDVVITSNEPLPELTLVFPEPGEGARVFGTFTASGGPPDASHLVSLQHTDNGTNYLASLYTDELGQFGTNVPPGRWEVQAYANCPLASAVVVSNQDVELNFAYSVPVPGESIPVSFSVVDDRGEPAPETWVNLFGFDYQYLPADPLLSHPLPPGIWEVSLANQGGIYYSRGPTPTPEYWLSPSLNWQLPPGITLTSLVLVTRHATSRIEGRLRDEQGRLLLSGYAAAWTSVNGTNFWAYGVIGSGYFSLNVFPGEWEVGADVSGYLNVGHYPGLVRGSSPSGSVPPRSLYTTPPSQFVRVSNEVARCEFVATNIPDRVTLTVTVVREDGNPVSGVNIFASGPLSSQHLYTPSDLDGTASFNIAPGPYRIAAHPGVYDVIVEPQFWPVLYADVAAPSNHVVLVARQPSTCIPGTISNAPSLGLQPQLFARTDVNGTNYSITVCPDTDGHYCAPAFPGQWTIALNSTTLPGNGIQTVAPREVTVPPAGAPPRADFTLTSIVGDFRTASLSRPVLLSDGRLRLELEGQAPLTWRIERSENLRDWTLVAIQSAAYRTLVIEEPTEPSRRAAFYRAVWVR